MCIALFTVFAACPWIQSDSFLFFVFCESLWIISENRVSTWLENWEKFLN